MFHYEILDWTRTCTAQLHVELVRGEHRSTETWTTRTSTWDQAHLGFADVGLGEDPRIYPRSDDQLVDEADALLVSEVTAMVDAEVDGHRLVLEEHAEATPDSEAALGALLVAWMLGPERVPAGLEPLLAEQFEYVDLAWL